MIGLIIGFNTANSTADMRMESIEEDMLYIIKLLGMSKNKEKSENSEQK
jgi:hypothetical protein